MDSSPRTNGTHGGRTPLSWADGHLDLAYLAVNGRDMLAPVTPDAPHAVSLRSLDEGGVRIALATIFTEAGGDPATERAAYRGHDDLDGAHEAGLRQLEWYEEMERRGHLRIVRCAGDLADTADAALRVVILMECADPIRTPDEAAWWHARGLRVVGLSWARGSRYAGGNARAGGLTDEGRRLVEALDALGIVHDASHLSRAAFDDLLEATDARVISSHSNAARLLPDDERHLLDDQIREIARRDGWLGLNLYGNFLAKGRASTIDDCVAHTMHLAGIAGGARVGLGSDLDGGFGRESLPEGIRSPVDLVRIADALERAGFASTGGTLEGFAHDNLLRVLRSALPSG